MFIESPEFLRALKLIQQNDKQEYEAPVSTMHRKFTSGRTNMQFTKTKSQKANDILDKIKDIFKE